MVFYNNFKNYLRSLCPRYYKKLDGKKVYIKYVFAGGTAAFVDLLLLFLLVDVLGIWYIYAATIAFLAAFFISFYLQKHWTFRDENKEVGRQMAMYFFIGGTNLMVNAGGMYLLVSRFSLNHILAQILMGALIGVSSFIIYRLIIFRKKIKIKKAEAVDENGNKKLRVLIATGIYPPDIGGPATYASNLRVELEKLGCAVKVISYGEEVSKKDGVYIVSRRQNILFRYFKYFWRVYRMLDWADVFYALDLVSAGLPTVLVARLKNKKAIFRTGGDFLWEKSFQKGWTNLPLAEYYGAEKNKKEKFLFSFAKGALKKFDLVLFSTEMQKNIYVKYYKLDEYKSMLMLNPVPKINITEADNFYNNSVVFAGRLINLKNLDRLIEVFSEIKDENLKLFIFGKGPEGKRLKEKIRSLRLDNKAEIKESVGHKNLMEIIAGCKFFILPSITEISPNLALECISMAKPIILTKNNGLNEEITKNIITVDPLSKNDLRDKINYLLNQDNLSNYIKKLKEINLEKREWSNVAREHLEIFKS